MWLRGHPGRVRRWWARALVWRRASIGLLVAILAPAGRVGAIPILDAGQPLSCPDPSVTRAPAAPYRYLLVCTSDYDPDAFPIRGSNDLRHWHLLGSVFPAGHQPWWAVHSPAGRYWAPSLYRIAGRWVLYFAAQLDLSRLHPPDPTGQPVRAGTFVLGVATARSLLGPWRTAVLHYRGQFNTRNGNRELYGGVIDPSMVRDPRTGRLYLFWAEQQSSIWAGRLTSDGLRLRPAIHQVLWVHPGWDCVYRSADCTVEGPVAYYRNGRFYLFYSGASTWNGTYAVGVATAPYPLRVFRRLTRGPILRSGPRWEGPGGCSAPVIGPAGGLYLFYHASLGPNPLHTSSYRYLLFSPLSWVGRGALYPRIGDGAAG